MDISRRKFVGGAAATAAVALAGGALSACSGESNKASDSAATETEKAVIGYWGGTCEAPIFVAYAKGYFAEEGLEPELTLLDAQGGTSSDTLVAKGEVDCYELTPDKFKPIQQGLTMRIVDSLHKGCIEGATTDKSIKTVDDLEGKKVAVNAEGTIAQLMISGRMAQHGKDPDKVDWVVYQNPLMDDAMRKGEIDAFSAYDPFADLSVAKGGGSHKFWSWHEDDESKDYLCCFVGVNSLSMDKSETLAPKLARAFKKANEFITENPEEAADIIIDGGYVEVGGDNGFTRDIMVDEIKAYTWISGDKQTIDDSFKWIWEQIWYAGGVEDKDITSIEKLDEWAMGDLYDAMVKYSGE